MGLLDEQRDSQDTPLNAALNAGLEQISYDQQVTFTKYVRVILPLDGYVFWVRADQVTPSSLFNAGLFNRSPFNTSPQVISNAATITAKCSLHYATDVAQDETETFATNRVVVSSQQEIVDFNEVGANVMFIGLFEGIRFAFNARGSFYRQADIFHYVGRAVYSSLASQIVDDPRTLDVQNLIITNSLPIWLSMNGYVKEEWEAFTSPPGRLFPSYLADQNMTPPFGTVHVAPEATRTIASTPNLDSTLSHSQLCSDTVKVTFYGLRNAAALEFIDFVNQFSVNTDLIGLMNSPVVKDEKKGQTEFNILAMKKSIEFEVSYYQQQARNIARQLIKDVLITYYLGDQPLP